ncbi:Fur-regulated basic protein FbpA [Bacillus pinisoli]|uniref:Fur-regulated basic protein FbpA n=1 Tax=Bacillus pinisoli TaxID=2901866 RepID=UPI001FF5F836|nr:Fur-regulated basic protein FbpA [Bacillus pinisoli]
MTKLLIAVERMKNYYAQKLVDAGFLHASESNLYSYTLKELEEMMKKINKQKN